MSARRTNPFLVAWWPPDYPGLRAGPDLRVTQVVNGNKGIHVMLAKRYLARE